MKTRTTWLIPMLCALLVSTAAAQSRPSISPTAQELEKKVDVIVKTAQSQYVNEDLHRQFCALVMIASSVSPDAAALPERLRRFNALNLTWLGESWLNARDCLRTGQSVQRPEMLAAADQLKGAYKDARWPDQVDEFVQENRAVCQAAASKTPYKSSKGTFYVTEELVDKVLDTVGPGVARMNKLLNPVWDSTPREQVFADIKVKVLSPEVFQRSTYEIEGAIGRARGVAYLAQLDVKRFIGFAQVQLPQGATTSDQSLVGMLKGAAKMVGATLEVWEVTSMQGSRALSACRTTEDASVGWVCMEVVGATSKTAGYMFMALGPTRTESDLMREQLTMQTLLMN